MKNKNSFSIPDLAKKVLLTGLGSASLARSVVKDTQLHKEILSSVLNKAEKTKDDVMGILAIEVSKFLGKVNVADEVTKALKGMIINLNASIDFQEKKGSKGVSPRVKIKKSRVVNR